MSNLALKEPKASVMIKKTESNVILTRPLKSNIESKFSYQQWAEIINFLQQSMYFKKTICSMVGKSLLIRYKEEGKQQTKSAMFDDYETEMLTSIAKQGLLDFSNLAVHQSFSDF